MSEKLLPRKEIYTGNLQELDMIKQKKKKQ